MNLIRFGIIGAGGNATGHAKKLAASPRATVVAVADPLDAAADKLAETVGARACADYRSFLDEVDAVVVSSPNRFHCEQAVACAEAGKHVYCEKPMGLNLPEATQIAEAVRQAGVKCAIGFTTSGKGTVRAILEAVEAGMIGGVLSIFSRRAMGLFPADAGHWRADHRTTGGLLLEINIHEIDWMMRAGGEVESVYARFRAEGQDDPRANDHLALVLNFAGGAYGLHQGSQRSLATSMAKAIDGSLGSIETNNSGGEAAFTPRDGKKRVLEPLPDLDRHADFLDAIEHGTPLYNDFEWGLKVMTVAEALFRSAAENRVVQLHELD